MAVKLTEIQKMVQKFRLLQKKNGVSESVNVVNMKWTMRDIAIDLDENLNHLDLLIRFFFQVAERKTWEEFTRTYDQYWDTFLEYRRDRENMAQLQRETLERTKKKNESRSASIKRTADQ